MADPSSQHGRQKGKRPLKRKVKELNILIYTIFYPAPPGLRTRPDTQVIHFFARELQRQGHRVQVIHMSCSALPSLLRSRGRDILPTEADYEYEGVPVHLFRIMTITPHRSCPEPFQAAILNRRIRALKESLGWKPEKVFVHFPTVFTGVTEIFADGVPVMGDFHNMDVLMLDKKYLTRGLNRKITDFIRRIDIWGYRNIRVLNRLKQAGPHAMVRTYTGIDRPLLSPAALIEEKIRTKGTVMHILYAGRLIPLKKVDILIRTVQQLDFPWDFTIIGEGPERPGLEELAKPASDRIRFTGALPREETLDRMRKADVFIMLSSPESYGMVYLEALASGCITAASRGEGFDGIIRDGENGFLEEAGSTEAAVRVLTRISRMGEEAREKMIRQGYALACSMTEDQTTRHFLENNKRS